MPSSIYERLQQSTVKLVCSQSSDLGTGFFVTSDQIITCAHVIQGYEASSISVLWNGQEYSPVTVEKIFPSPVDLALLKIKLYDKDYPPCVWLGEELKPFDRLYVYGYPHDFPEGGSVTIQCEGDVREQGIKLIKAQAGQIRRGHSGSPALNYETEKVCGVISETRGDQKDLGGLLIPVTTLFTHFPDLKYLNGDLRSERFGSNYYARLEQFLSEKNWKAADQETSDLMFALMDVKREFWAGERFFPNNAMKLFPCLDLRNINSLWVKYSQGRFGFSVQKKIWQSFGSPSQYGSEWERFGTYVGWRSTSAISWLGGTSWLHFNSLCFDDKTACRGHLPGITASRYFHGRRMASSLNSARALSFSSIMSRITECDIE